MQGWGRRGEPGRDSGRSSPLREGSRPASPHGLSLRRTGFGNLVVLVLLAAAKNQSPTVPAKAGQLHLKGGHRSRDSYGVWFRPKAV